MARSGSANRGSATRGPPHSCLRVLVIRRWPPRSSSKRSFVIFIVWFSLCLGFVNLSCDNTHGAMEIETVQARLARFGQEFP